MAMIAIPTNGPDDWRRLLRDPREWRPGRPAWALAHCWEAAGGLPPEVQELLGRSFHVQQIEPLSITPVPAARYEDGNSAGIEVRALIRCDAEPALLVVGARAIPRQSGPHLAAASPTEHNGIVSLAPLSGAYADPTRVPLEQTQRLFRLVRRLTAAAGRLGASHAIRLFQVFGATHPANSRGGSAAGNPAGDGSGVLHHFVDRQGIVMYLGAVNGDDRFLEAAA